MDLLKIICMVCVLEQIAIFIAVVEICKIYPVTVPCNFIIYLIFYVLLLNVCEIYRIV